jgi:hypothetical protein
VNRRSRDSSPVVLRRREVCVPSSVRATIHERAARSALGNWRGLVLGVSEKIVRVRTISKSNPAARGRARTDVRCPSEKTSWRRQDSASDAEICGAVQHSTVRSNRASRSDPCSTLAHSVEGGRMSWDRGRAAVVAVFGGPVEPSVLRLDLGTRSATEFRSGLRGEQSLVFGGPSPYFGTIREGVLLDSLVIGPQEAYGRGSCGVRQVVHTRPFKEISRAMLDFIGIRLPRRPGSRNRFRSARSPARLQPSEGARVPRAFRWQVGDGRGVRGRSWATRNEGERDDVGAHAR